ncbi:MAG: ABC transporter permease [Longimicrobiales bacterium]
MATLLQDFRYALRGIRTNPLFSGAIVLTLAFGIGANTTIYSVIDGVVLNPFPFPDPNTLVDVGSEYPQLNRPLTFVEHLSPAEFEDIRDQGTTLTDLVAWDMGNRQIATDTDAVNVFTGFWWGDAFQPLRVQSELGRGFAADETGTESNVAVISHRIWQTHFGSDAGVLDQTIEINSTPYDIIGVMPEGTLLYGMDLWIPMPVGPEVFPRDARQFQILGRIAAGLSMSDVSAELEGLARRTELEYGGEFPEYADFHLTPATWTEANVSQLRPAALALLGSVLAVLLIVCANVANLLLSKSSTRRREVAIRTALGASRGRLIRQLLTESVTLALVGGLLGLGLARFGVEWSRAIVANIPFIAGDVALSGRSMTYTAAAAILSGIVFGLAPALHAAVKDLRGVLGGESASTTGSRTKNRLQRWFVGAEVALAMLLLFGGGLMVNSLIRLNRADTGFRHENLLTMRLTVPWEEYAGSEIAEFFEGLAERVRQIPGVQSTTVASQFPPMTFGQARIALPGQEAVEDEGLPTTYVTQAGDDFFNTLGVQLLAGRTLGPQDREETPLVTVVNDAFRSRYFPGQDPIGQSILVSGGEEPSRAEIVGVASATRNRGFSEPAQPEIFASVRQLSGSNNQLFLIVRTEGEPRSVLPAIRNAVREMDSDQPIYSIRTMEEVFAGTTRTQSLATASLGVFALFALALAALGIYAVVAFTVAQRKQEIGLRLALGATAESVQKMVVGRALIPVVVGTLAGSGLALALGRLLSGLLFEVEATDITTLVLVGVLFVGVAVAASYIPARRASLLDPSNALRQE